MPYNCLSPISFFENHVTVYNKVLKYTNTYSDRDPYPTALKTSTSWIILPHIYPVNLPSNLCILQLASLKETLKINSKMAQVQTAWKSPLKSNPRHSIYL